MKCNFHHGHKSLIEQDSFIFWTKKEPPAYFCLETGCSSFVVYFLKYVPAVGLGRPYLFENGYGLNLAW